MHCCVRLARGESGCGKSGCGAQEDAAIAFLGFESGAGAQAQTAAHVRGEDQLAFAGKCE